VNSFRLGFAAGLGAVGAVIGVGCAAVVLRALRAPGATRNTPAQRSAAYLLAMVPAVVLGSLGPILHLDEIVRRLVFPPSPYERMLERAGTSLTDDPLFRQRLAGKSEAEAHALTRELSAKGVLRLGLADLRRTAEIRDDLAARAAGLCAGMWTGKQTADAAALEKLMRELPPGESEDLLRLTMEAGRLELHGEGVPPSPPDAERAVAAILAVVADGGRGGAADDFRRIVGQGEAASPEDGCRAVHMALQAVQTMGDADARSVMGLFL
jgi:hypothetical protein